MRGKYYSDTTSEAAWPGVDAKRQRTLSHIGRIEETVAGVIAASRCERCEQERYDDCTVYTDAARAKYFSKRVGYGCSRCRYGGRSCTFQQEAAATAPSLKKRRTMADAEKEIAELKRENADLKAKMAFFEEEFTGFDD